MGKLKKPVMLMILDGFGLGDPNDPTNAVERANMPVYRALLKKYGHTKVSASGMDVGLPEGQMGNSEVGHLNLGAGRIVYQELTRISKDANDGSLFEKPLLKDAYEKAKTGKLHILGLLSDGGVHSHIEHMEALIKGAKEAGVKELYVHAFLDGRDVPPSSANQYIERLEEYMGNLGLGKIATISGRYYAMDRDNRWERISLAYEAMVDGMGYKSSSALEALNEAYKREETDEFVKPTYIEGTGLIEENDSIIFANFRPDRARQLTKALSLENFDGFERKKGFLPLHIATMTSYEEGLPVNVIYIKETLNNTLGQVLADNGLKQLRIAETEKYAHVTYFFNGGREELFQGEDRILVNSPKVATYDLQPEMSIYEVTDKVVDAINSNTYDMIILNYANPDMVGHTGNFEAAKKALEAVDKCIARVVEAMGKIGGHLMITADHGNCDIMVDHRTNIPHTAHTTNLVPLILVSPDYDKCPFKEGRLCDLAPTMLDLGGISKPEEMTGESLLIK